MTLALVKYAKGWATVGVLGDEEISVSHGDYTDLGSVTTVVEAEIEEATDDENTVTHHGVITGIRTAEADYPLDDAHDIYTGTNLGDGNYVPDADEATGLERLRSITVTEVDTGVAKRDVEWNSIAEEDSLRQQRQLNIWTPGGLSGRSDAISPVSLGGPSAFGQMSSGSVTTYSNSGFLVAEVDPTDPTDPGHSEWQLITQDCVAFAINWTMTGSDPDDGVVFGIRRRTADLSTTLEIPYTISADAIVPLQNTATGGFLKTFQGFYTNEIFLNGEYAQIFIYSCGFYSAGISIDLRSTSLY